VRWISDNTVEHLRHVADLPDLSGTKYRPLHEIGRGGMGTVYFAEDTSLGRNVAVKVVDEATFGGSYGQRMRREAQIIARLEHPGIVPIHDLGTLPDGRFFYAMKLVRGSRLDEFVETETSLPERLRVFRTACEAVAFAHAHGVIHRDLKPQNIMVGAFGEVLVMDWGIANVIDPKKLDATELITAEAGADERSGSGPFLYSEDERAEKTNHGTIMGTPGYMAPEQARGDIAHTDERSDIYSLGAILYFILTSRGLFSSNSVNEAGIRPESPKHPRALNPGIPKPLGAIVMKAMSAEPTARYPQVSALAEDISRFLSGETVSAYPENLLERLNRWVSNNRFMVFLVVAYLVMRIFLILYSSR
jgi:serine/threonine protein kinase